MQAHGCSALDGLGGRLLRQRALRELFATLECELIERRRFRNRVEARMAVFRFIEGWYNPRRRHSALGYKSPVNFEAKYSEAA